ncbi:E3 binding domain-containing protein [Deinococcus sp.]|uniref:E3 binding domain-containing protein n=1 Tax=Deinococcus sp. TaxID=47478 RepID=UPI003C7BD00B
MDSISPLAKILAEANGIDWRSIRGSGEGGSVVEQDILNYLSRVMSGDEEPPATPVDEAPPGWTGEMPPMPAAVAASGLQALSAAGVESDITDFVAQQSQNGQAPSGEVQASGRTAVPEAALPATTVFRPTEPPAPVASAEPLVPAAQVALPTPHAAPKFELAQPGEAADAADDDLEFELDDEPGEEPTGDAPRVPAVAALPEARPVAPSPEMPVRPFPERPAYDPVPLDEEADFVLADAFPAADAERASPLPEAIQAAAPTEYAFPAATTPIAATMPISATTDASPVNTTPPVSPMRQAATAQEAASEVAATAGGFGLGGFLSRLYGAKTEPAPSEPTSQAEPTIGAAHSEAVPLPVPVQATEAGGPAEPAPVRAEPVTPLPVTPRPVVDGPVGSGALPAENVLGEAVLGEPLISQAPPIPDTPVAAPLVADQWRDQEAVTEQAAQGEATPGQAHLAAPPMIDHAMSGPDQGAAEQAMAEQALEAPAQAPAAGHPDLSHLELGQPIALPEAHEGGVEAGAPTEPARVTPGFPQAAGLALGAVGVAAGLAAHAHHEPPQATGPSSAEVQDAPTGFEAAPPGPAEAPAAEVAPALPETAPPASFPPSGAQAQAITLRLNVDLGVLETARTQLSEALFREVPIGLLVARAAARSLGTLSLSEPGGVALADHTGRPLAADLSGDLRASLGSLSEPAHSAPALLVLDASGLGLDELHRGEYSLSVGRNGSEGATLSLRGDLDPARGAQFLHEVAGLLGTPIRLLF